jgi:tetratricopeptide (TPR) repeat protein
MKFRSFACGIFLSILIAAPLSARAADFIEVYTYRAGENDSKLACRAVSLIEVKRLLLEKIGTYLETRTAVKNFQITSDEIVAMTAGIVRTEILREDWNGETYRLTARIEADPDDIAGEIDKMRKNKASTETVRRLAEVNEASLERMREMQDELERIQSNLVKVNQDLANNEGLLSAWNLLEEGVSLRQGDRPREAAAVISRALDENPTAIGYHERGKAYLELGMYQKAVADFSAALNLEPNRRGSLFFRGKANWKLGRKKAAADDMKKAAELGQGQAKRWLQKHQP